MSEQRIRSLAKGCTWRILATTDTILLALIFTGSVGAAFSIGGIELFTKIAWYYVHERLWVHAAGPRSHPKIAEFLENNARARSILKAVSWRTVGAVDTFLISLLITGHLGVSGSIGATELITKITIYYLHERLWHHIPWGAEAAGTDAPVKKPSVFGDALAVLKYYYHLGAAIGYALASFAFVFACAGVVYLLHALIIHW